MAREKFEKTYCKDAYLSIQMGACGDAIAWEYTQSGNSLVRDPDFMGIEAYGDSARLPLEDGSWQELSLDTLVSMNLFGFTPSFITELKNQFPHFLSCELPQNPQKAEFFLPGEVNRLMAEGKAKVRVLSSTDKWFGVTYAGDKPLVTAAIERLTNEGLYPDGLWKK